MNTFTSNNINKDNYEESDFFEDLIDEIIFEENFEVTNPVPKPKLKREVNTHFDVDKTKTIWYIHYLLYPKLDNRKFLALFRRRFRMPYESFARLLITIKHEEAFIRWHEGKRTCTGKPCAPIGLLLLGALRYLGRGFTFDDLFEATGMGEEVHRCFFMCSLNGVLQSYMIYTLSHRKMLRKPLLIRSITRKLG